MIQYIFGPFKGPFSTQNRSPYALSLSILALAISGLLFAPGLQAAKPAKIDICHVPNHDPLKIKQISVGAKGGALADHLLHGNWRVSDSCQPANNLSAKKLDIITLNPRIGYPLKVSVSIDAVEAEENVGLAFFAVNKDRSTVRQIALGADVIELVDVGKGSYEVDLDIPSKVETPGHYRIRVVVDAANIVAETDEGDNDTSTVVSLSLNPVPNLFIENVEIDRTAIELQEKISYYEQTAAGLGVVNSDAGATLTWGVKGTQVPIEVETYAVLRLTRTAPSEATPLFRSRDAITIAPTPSGADTTNSHDVPLYLWNSEEVRYMNAYGRDTSIICIPNFTNSCPPTLPVEYLPVGPVGEMLVPSGVSGEPDVLGPEFARKSAHLDFYFPGKLAQEIGQAARGNFLLFGPIVPPPDLSQADINALRSFMPTGLPQEVTAAFCVKIRPVDITIVEDSLDDNDICTPVALLLPALPPIPSPPSPTPLLLTSATLLSTEPLPTTEPSLRTPANPVAFEQPYRNAWGGSFFGFSMDFSASTTADDRGVIVNGQGSIPARVFGQNIEFIKVEGRGQVLPNSSRYIPPEGQSPGFNLVLSHQGAIVRSIRWVGTQWSLPIVEISFSKSVVGIKNTVFVGPVPVALEASLSGSLGVRYNVNIDKDIDGDPYEGIELGMLPFASAEVSAAAAVDLLIADVGIEGVLTLFEEGFSFTAGGSIEVLDHLHTTDLTSEIKIVPRLRVVNVLKGTAGALNVFVSVKFPFIKLIRYYYTLASYASWEKEDVLFDQSETIFVVITPNEPAAYFQ